MAINKAEKARRQSILLAAIGAIAKKSVDRAHLPEPSSADVKASIDGMVGRKTTAIQLQGTLSVGGPSARNSSRAAPTEQIVGFLLSQMPDDVSRAKLLESAAAHFARHGELPQLDSQMTEHARAWLARLKQTQSRIVAGSVSFQGSIE